MSSFRRDSRLDRVYQCVRIAGHRYLATCQNGIALIDTTTQIAVSGWVEHERPLGIVRTSDTTAAFVDAEGGAYAITVTGNTLTTMATLIDGCTRPWAAYADGRIFSSGRSPSEWKDDNGAEGSFGGHAADFVSSFGNQLYAFDKAGWLSIYDLDEDRVVEVTELAGCTGGIAILELPQDGRFSYVSLRDRLVYVYESAPGGYVVTSQTPVDYVDGLPGDIPWWNQSGVVAVQPPVTFGNGWVYTEERAPAVEPDFPPVPDETPPNAPVIAPPGGAVLGGSSFTITSDEVGGVIRYTVDGSTPNGSSPIYTVPVVLATAGTITVKAIVIDLDGHISPVTTAVFTVSYAIETRRMSATTSLIQRFGAVNHAAGTYKIRYTGVGAWNAQPGAPPGAFNSYACAYASSDTVTEFSPGTARLDGATVEALNAGYESAVFAHNGSSIIGINLPDVNYADNTDYNGGTEYQLIRVT